MDARADVRHAKKNSRFPCRRHGALLLPCFAFTLEAHAPATHVGATDPAPVSQEDKPFTVLAFTFMTRDDLKSPDCTDGRTVFTINTYVPHSVVPDKDKKGAWQASIC